VLQFGVCLLVGVAASIEDLWRRRISNLTIVAGLGAGLIAQVMLCGWWRGAGIWLAGAAAGFAVFLVFYLAGGMGGGDIKLMAAFGACLGAGQRDNSGACLGKAPFQRTESLSGLGTDRRHFKLPHGGLAGRNQVPPDERPI